MFTTQERTFFRMHTDFWSHCIKAAITFRMFPVIMGALVLHQHRSHNPREEHPAGYFCSRQQQTHNQYSLSLHHLFACQALIEEKCVCICFQISVSHLDCQTCHICMHTIYIPLRHHLEYM